MSRLAERAATLAPRRILIVRLSALGDVVLSSGLIPALKARWPEARLSWLVDAPAAPLLAHNPRLDELLVLPLGQWKQLWRSGRRLEAWRAFRAWARELRARQFDLVIDPQGLLKSGLCGWFSGAPLRVSLWPREGNQFSVHDCVRPAIPPGPERIISFEYRALAAAVGAPDFRLDLAVGQAPRQQAIQVLQEAGIQGRPVAILAPFTTRPQKHWLEECWPALGAALWEAGYQPVVLGGPGDREAADRIAGQEARLVNLTGRLKLDETVAAIAQSQLLIGVDTGLTHMGIALGLPTVALFGSTAPYLHAGSDRVRVLYKALPCSPCHRAPTCGGRFDCMRELSVADTMSAVRQVTLADANPLAHL